MFMLNKLFESESESTDMQDVQPLNNDIQYNMI